MGFFDSLFGSSASKYSNIEHQLSEFDIKRFVSEIKVHSLKHVEENLVEQAIIARRRGDGKISLRQIYEVVRDLRYAHKISDQDKKGLMKVFEEYFSQFGG